MSSFEHRTITDSEGDISLTILAEGGNFDMLSLEIKSKDIFYDSDTWLKYTLYPALSSFVFRCQTEEHKETLEEFLYNDEDKYVLYEMFVRAEANGWLYGIKNYETT